MSAPIEVTVRVNTEAEADTIRAVAAGFHGAPTEYYCKGIQSWIPWGTVLGGDYRPALGGTPEETP